VCLTQGKALNPGPAVVAGGPRGDDVLRRARMDGCDEEGAHRGPTSNSPISTSGRDNFFELASCK
jgi:hypothetical protein